MDRTEPSEAGQIPVFKLQASSGWGFPDFGEIWSYRELLYFLVLRDIKVRYRQTISRRPLGCDPAVGSGCNVYARLRSRRRRLLPGRAVSAVRLYRPGALDVVLFGRSVRLLAVSQVGLV